MMVGEGWTPERVKRLRELIADGLPASQIARELRGISRGAVCGKADRLGLTIGGARPKPAPKPVMPRQRIARGSINPSNIHNKALSRARDPGLRPSPLVTGEPPSLGLSIVDLTDETCKWPHGHGGEKGWNFCGHPVWNHRPPNMPYCEAHVKRALP